MARRLNLQETLEELLQSENVYYQPPPSVHLKYPCIIYRDYVISQRYANNTIYGIERSYTVTLITRQPDDPLAEKLAWLPKCRFERAFTNDNLYHWVYRIYE